MAASPADTAQAHALGGVIVADATAPGPAARAPCGTRYVFRPGADAVPGTRHAIDVEARGIPAPAPLRAFLGGVGTDAAMRYWTVLETVAKLADVPVLSLLKHHGRAALPGLTAPTGTIDHDGLRIRYERCDTDRLWAVAAATCEREPLDG